MIPGLLWRHLVCDGRRLRPVLRHRVEEELSLPAGVSVMELHPVVPELEHLPRAVDVDVEEDGEGEAGVKERVAGDGNRGAVKEGSPVWVVVGAGAVRQAGGERGGEAGRRHVLTLGTGVQGEHGNGLVT